MKPQDSQQNQNSQPYPAAPSLQQADNRASVPVPPAPDRFAQPSYNQPASMPPAPMSGQPKSRSKLYFAIAGVLVLLVVVVIFFGLMLPGIQAHAAATAYMDAAAHGDSAKLVSLTGDNSTDNQTFEQDVADSLKGSFTLTDHTVKNGKYYMLYTLTGAKSKYARVIVEKQNGKYAVTSIVYGNDPLALIPGNSTASSQTTATPAASAPTSTSAPTAPAAQACLVNSDYRWWEYDKSMPSVTFDTTFDPSNYTNNATTDIFFNPDVTTETSVMSIYDDMADFANHNSDKQWSFRLEGSTYGPDSGTAASKQLADARANEVKTQLVNRGVPASRIIVDPPHDYSQEAQDDSMNEIYRRVQVVVDPTCTATSATSVSGR